MFYIIPKMEEIQSINGWQTSTSTDFYKFIQTRNSKIQQLRQIKANTYQNSVAVGTKKKFIMDKQKNSIKNNIRPFQLKAKNQQSQTIISKRKSVKNIQFSAQGQGQSQKQHKQNYCIQKYNQAFLQDKIMRQGRKLHSLKRQDTSLSQFQFASKKQKYNPVQSKRQRRQKENFCNKQLVFCSTMMQKQRSQRIQCIYYKGKQKNTKNRYFFAQRLQKLNSRNMQIDKQYIFQVHKSQQKEIKLKKSIQLQPKMVNDQKKDNKLKPKPKNKSRIKYQHTYLGNIGHEKKSNTIDQKHTFKYFPTIFKTEKSSDKYKTFKDQNWKNSKIKNAETQLLNKSHKRNSSEFCFRNKADRLTQLKNSFQISGLIQFNDYKLSETAHKSSLTPLVNQQHNKFLLK